MITSSTSRRALFFEFRDILTTTESVYPLFLSIVPKDSHPTSLLIMSSHRASSSSSTSAEKPSSSSHPAPSKPTQTRVMRHVPWTQHTFRQLKLLLPGAAVTYYLHTLDEFWDVLHGSGGSWAQSVSTSLVYSFTMLTFFCFFAGLYLCWCFCTV